MSDGWVQMRVAAGVLLAAYIGVAAAMSYRELRFLSSIEPRQRRLFALQDILVQLGILGVLLPCAFAPGPSKPLFILIMAGFTLLWAAALWAGVSRSMYTYRLMLGARAERQELADILSRGGDLPHPRAGSEPAPTEPGDA
jgi:hypothetical protein